jgi:salicylate hydroxylase
MSAPKVLIRGCGVAGPAVALFLRRKGYIPVVLERSTSADSEGSALGLAPNGYVLIVQLQVIWADQFHSLKVLSALGITSGWKDVIQPYEQSLNITYDGILLTKSSLSSVLERYGHPMGGILRSFLNRSLKDALSSAGIPVISKFKVSAIVEEEDQITVVAEDGRREEGSFVIGCDGLNSVVGASIIKSHNKPVELVDFTGIVQVRLLLLVLENELNLIRYRSTAQRHIAHPTINARSSQQHYVHLWSFFIFHVLPYYIQQLFMGSLSATEVRYVDRGIK